MTAVRRSGTDVLDQPAAVLVVGHAANLECIAERHVEDAGHVVHFARVVIRLDAEADLAFELVGGRLRREVERAAQRVATEIRALRTAQHLDSLHVDQQRVRHTARHRGDAEFIEVVADRVHDGVLAGDEVVDAADRDAETACARLRILGEAHVRRLRQVVRSALDVLALDLLRRERADADRDLLQVLFTALSRDDDFLETAAVLCLAGDGRERRETGGEQVELFH